MRDGDSEPEPEPDPEPEPEPEHHEQPLGLEPTRARCVGAVVASAADATCSSDTVALRNGVRMPVLGLGGGIFTKGTDVASGGEVIFMRPRIVR